jgi:hypothetical protein
MDPVVQVLPTTITGVSMAMGMAIMVEEMDTVVPPNVETHLHPTKKLLIV